MTFTQCYQQNTQTYLTRITTSRRWQRANTIATQKQLNTNPRIAQYEKKGEGGRVEGEHVTVDIKKKVSTLHSLQEK